MGRPKSLDSGVKKYMEFHKLEPKKVGTFAALKIPKWAYLGGEAIDISYYSTKWADPASYIHTHEAGVTVYFVYENVGPAIEVPLFIKEAEVLVKLGDCLEFSYKTPEGEFILAETDKPRPTLYCTPCGKALIVVDGNDIITITWGGFLDVEGRGIVG